MTWYTPARRRRRRREARAGRPGGGAASPESSPIYIYIYIYMYIYNHYYHYHYHYHYHYYHHHHYLCMYVCIYIYIYIYTCWEAGGWLVKSGYCCCLCLCYTIIDNIWLLIWAFGQNLNVSRELFWEAGGWPTTTRIEIHCLFVLFRCFIALLSFCFEIETLESWVRKY